MSETKEFFYSLEEAEESGVGDDFHALAEEDKQELRLYNIATYLSANKCYGEHHRYPCLNDYEEDYNEFALYASLRNAEDYEEDDDDDIKHSWVRESAQTEPDKWVISSDETNNWSWNLSEEWYGEYKPNHIDISMQLDGEMRRLNIQPPYATTRSWRNCVTPIWQSTEDLLEIRSYKVEARRKTEESKKLFEEGEIEKPLVYHMDHIIPLTPKKIRGQGPTISGIHAASNLQILERGENIRKSNNLTGEPLRDKHGRSRVLSDRILVEKPKNWKAYEVIFEV
tara:strand:+ start:233 stop:1081 length:849 start_codon:yes stop_codon:yes gene_type:complete